MSFRSPTATVNEPLPWAAISAVAWNLPGWVTSNCHSTQSLGLSQKPIQSRFDPPSNLICPPCVISSSAGKVIERSLDKEQHRELIEKVLEESTKQKKD